MAASLAGLLLVAVASLNLADAHEGGSLRGQERQLQKLDQNDQYIWGKCDNWANGVTGCTLGGGLQCGSFLSDGPADADIKLMLSNLPPSTPEKDVHLQWWAAKRNPWPYNPLRHPELAGVWKNMSLAYANYTEAAFNGGNVRVDESGNATIRIRLPSTYQVDKIINWPHIHLRLCEGDNETYASSDSIYFTDRGVLALWGFNGDGLVSMANRNWNCTGSNCPGANVTTTTGISGWSTTTTIVEVTTTAPMDPGMVSNFSGYTDMRLKDARAALDMDALEFSPVYHCLLEDSFFNYFDSTCSKKCPPSADVVIGQCVKKEIDDKPVQIEAVWKMQLRCGDTCWHDKMNVTLHMVRVAVAGQLVIPFQEVVMVALEIQSTQRRLQGGLSGDPSLVPAKLYVVVRTKRVTLAAGGQMLRSMPMTPTRAKWLLGFQQVASVVAPDGSVATESSIVQAGENVVSVSDSSDPYAAAYARAAPKNPVLPGLNIDATSAPAVVIYCAAAAAVVVLVAVFAFIWYRRRKAARNPQMVEGRVVTGTVAPPTGKEEDGPTKPHTVGCPVVSADADYPQKPSSSSGAGVLGGNGQLAANAVVVRAPARAGGDGDGLAGVVTNGVPDPQLQANTIGHGANPN